MNEHEGEKALPTLVLLTTNEELLSWAEKVKPYAPHCASIYNNLTLHGGGYVSHGRFYVLQGRPNAHVVVYEGTFHPGTQHFGLFCLEEEVDQLTEALSTASFVDWEGKLIFHHIPAYLLGHMQQLTKEKRTNMTLLSCIAFIYHPHLDTEPLRIGPEFRVCRLGKAGIHRLIETARFGGLHLLEVMSSMAQHVPFVGVYRDSHVTQDTTVDPNSLPTAGDEEVPVAWVCTNFMGDVGKLMTDVGYRGQGLGSVIVNTVARQQDTLFNMIPHAFLDTVNYKPPNLNGWKPINDVFWLYN